MSIRINGLYGLALTAALSLSVDCFGQGGQGSLYTRNMLGNLKTANSASNFSTRRIAGNVVRSSVPRYAYSNVNKNIFGQTWGGPGTQKPFSGANRNPSVTPYLGLSSPFTSTANSYYSQIRPHQDQERINQQVEARNAALQRQLNSMTAVPPYDVRGDGKQAPTGHQSVYMNYGGYYQAPTGQRK